MRISIIIISLLFLVSCNEIQKKRWCKEGVIQAKKEIKKEGLVYVKNFRRRSSIDRYNKELKMLLSQKNITLKYEVNSCLIIVGQDQKKICYQKTMVDEIENKFGKGFLERMENQADEIFANKKDYIFEEFELDNKPYFIKEREYHNAELFKYFKKNLKFPEGYIISETNKERPFIDLNFIIDKEGIPRNFTFGNSKFPKEKKKFKKYFEREILDIISKIPKWEPGRIHGKKVDSKVRRRISFDSIHNIKIKES